ATCQSCARNRRRRYFCCARFLWRFTAAPIAEDRGETWEPVSRNFSRRRDGTARPARNSQEPEIFGILESAGLLRPGHLHLGTIEKRLARVLERARRSGSPGNIRRKLAARIRRARALNRTGNRIEDCALREHVCSAEKSSRSAGRCRGALG